MRALTLGAYLTGRNALQAAEFADVGINDEGWVFTDCGGEPIHPQALSQAFERSLTPAGRARLSGAAAEEVLTRVRRQP